MNGTRHHLSPAGLLLLALTLICGTFAPHAALAGATIQIVNVDGPGEGFNDTTPWTPTGGNPATTLGQARLNAFTHAAQIWGALLQSNVTIRVEAQMDALTCTPTSGVLGSAGAWTFVRDFVGAPLANTWYPLALANSLRGADIFPSDPDIVATFNSTINNNPGCLDGASWYYGYDRNAPQGDIDFVTVVMHELGHGFGFQTLVDLGTGAKPQGYNDVFMLHLNRAGASPPDYPSMSDAQRVAASVSDPQLRWSGSTVSYMQSYIPLTAGLNGPFVRMHAPNPQQPGSSVAHWTPDATPDEVMEPSFTTANHDPGLAVFLMKDIGWMLDSTVGVTFHEVSAVPRGDAVTISWRFTTDEPLAGFNLYRQLDGRPVPSLVNPDGLLPVAPGSYTDTAVVPGGSYRYTVAAVRPNGTEVLSPAVAVAVAGYASELDQNHPNPFNAATELRYRLGRAGHVRLRVFDLSGRLVRTLIDASQAAGPHVVLWNGRDDRGRALASGTYFYRLELETGMQTRRMVLLK